MPNAKVLSEKQALVQALADRIQNAACGVFIDYKGITVAEDTALRKEMRENNVEYTVVKNTLARFAVDTVGYKEFEPILNGTTSLATCTDDAIAPARIACQYADKLGDRFSIKGGFVEGKVLSLDELNSLGKLSSKNDLYAQLLGTMLAPISALAVVLKAISEKDQPAAE